MVLTSVSVVRTHDLCVCVLKTQVCTFPSSGHLRRKCTCPLSGVTASFIMQFWFILPQLHSSRQQHLFQM